MRDPGSGGGISCRCSIFLRDREARQSNLGNFLQPCKAQLCPACPPEKRLAVPSSARPGAFAGAGPGKSGDSNWTGLGEGVLAHFIRDSRGGWWAAAGMRGPRPPSAGTSTILCLSGSRGSGRLIDYKQL